MQSRCSNKVTVRESREKIAHIWREQLARTHTYTREKAVFDNDLDCWNFAHPPSGKVPLLFHAVSSATGGTGGGRIALGDYKWRNGRWPLAGKETSAFKSSAGASFSDRWHPESAGVWPGSAYVSRKSLVPSPSPGSPFSAAVLRNLGTWAVGKKEKMKWSG